MPRIGAGLLRTNVAALFSAAGMDGPKAAATADILVEADMIGHRTHGVGLVPWYLESLANGELKGTGDFTVIGDRGSCITWNGNRLPGPWLLTRALDMACERVKNFGVVTVAMSRCHHTGALAAYLRKVTALGYAVEISCSTPSQARVAPFGGTVAMMTPNPQAFGFPAHGDPILIDMSSSITTTTHTRQLAQMGERFPEAWALTASGAPTDDPREVTERGGTLMPLGGTLKGYKGFSLALAIEARGQGLSGYGRADRPSGMELSVFIQVIDPAAFAGLDAFIRQSSHLVDLCHGNPPAEGGPAVRVPGEHAAASHRRSLADGVLIDAAVLDALRARSESQPLEWSCRHDG